MTKIGVAGRVRSRFFVTVIFAIIGLAFLELYRSGSLVGGMSSGELKAAAMPVGWHGIYHDPLYLPLKLVRSLFFWIFSAHGQTITRLPNVIFGFLAVGSLVALIRLWHNWRTAIMTGALFATGAWTLHASRLASFDGLYLWTTPTLLLINVLLYRYANRALAWYASLVAIGLLLYVPGAVWLLAIDLFLLRQKLFETWKQFDLRQRVSSIILVLVWWPLLLIDLLRAGQFVAWLGLPAHWPGLKLLAKHFLAVPVHLFVRGPQYPDIWLGRSPILDIFSLVLCLIGIWFYALHLRAGRSQLLTALAVAGWILVALGGPVGLSLLVPLLYVAAATGLAYLLHEWLGVFPVNPLARGFGLTLLGAAVALACIYNLRAYFIAWPHNPTTRATFQSRLRR